jgi:hypothetical protein
MLARARWSALVTALFGALVLFPIGSTAGCGGGNGGSGFGSSGGGSGGGGSGGSSGSFGGSGGSSGSFGGSGGSSGGSSGGGVACPPGLQCNVSCSGSTTTTISGTVYDPAGHDPLYNIAVYVPAVSTQGSAPYLHALPKGVPTGADACNCSALFQDGAVVSTSTGVDGTFTLNDAPVGSNVPLVIQVGKWRKLFKINVTACQDNAQADKSLLLPNSTVGQSTDDNIPDIAVSTGEADSLECLMTRIGLPQTEYVAGAATGGHVHIFSGGGTGGGGLGGGAGRPEANPMAGAPASDTSLWDSQNDLMPYDIVLLSCEGGETYNANPQNLEAYLNAGGRAFASHFHYAWFSGPIGSGQSYTAPADWGNNLATWAADGTTGNGPIDGVVDQTLNGSTAPFPKGVALEKWLGIVGALGQNGETDLSIYQPRYNAQVSASNVHSQPWINSSPHTMYFSFDTPVDAPDAADGGPPSYCGRAVFSDLHVAGDPTTHDTSPPPGGCADGDLSPQEKALEFMLFDLSSCVIPDTVAPPDAGVPQAQ